MCPSLTIAKEKLSTCNLKEVLMQKKRSGDLHSWDCFTCRQRTRGSHCLPSPGEAKRLIALLLRQHREKDANQSHEEASHE